ncbi:MAG: MFS transporter [Dehalococcoidia bacterium]|nr:MFS transporter [Dehalococcoidia bacterium]
MSESTPDNASPRHDPLAALRQPNFLLFTSSRTFYGIGVTMLQTVMLWQVYEISDSPLALGLTGLARLIPSLIFTLIGGAAADSYNRRNIVLATQTVPIVCGVVLALATIDGWVTLGLIYGLVVAMGVAASFEGPARVAILPAIVRPETFANAVTVTSTLQSFAFVAGPALGGIFIAVIGVGGSYGVFVALAIMSVLTMALLRYVEPPKGAGGVTIAAIKEGVVFVRANQVLLGAMALDMFAVIFGGVKALLPIYASDILEVGPKGFGLLNASFEIGAFLMSFVLLVRPPTERSGRALIWAVVIFGAVTVLFGFSRNFYLSLVLYALIGASDMISVVMRSTTIQLATPDALRGRVSAVNQVFIQSSNQMNTLYSGIVASVTNATFAVVSGGFGTLFTVGLIGWRLPKLYSYRIPKGGVVKSEATKPAEEEEPPSSDGTGPTGKAKPEETPSAAP